MSKQDQTLNVKYPTVIFLFNWGGKKLTPFLFSSYEELRDIPTNIQQTSC
jgi:hypothetical protein